MRSRAFGMFYPDERDRRTGKALVYCDLLYPLGPQGEELRESVARSEEALSLLAPYQHLPECRYASALFEVCRQKALLLTELRPRYLAGDGPGWTIWRGGASPSCWTRTKPCARSTGRCGSGTTSATAGR